MHVLHLKLIVMALAVLFTTEIARAQAPPPIPAGWPDLSGTWKGSWGGVPTTLVIFKKSEAAFVGQALSGQSNFAQAVVGQNDGEVRGTLSTDGRGGPMSVTVNGRMGIFNGRLTLVLNAQPGWLWSDSQEIVFTTVTQERLAGSGRSTAQWGPAGEIELKREVK